MSKHPGQEKTWPEAQPEAPAHSYKTKKTMQNSKQQRCKNNFWGKQVLGKSALENQF